MTAVPNETQGDKLKRRLKLLLEEKPYIVYSVKTKAFTTVCFVPKENRYDKYVKGNWDLY